MDEQGWVPLKLIAGFKKVCSLLPVSFSFPTYCVYSSLIHGIFIDNDGMFTYRKIILMSFYH